MAQHADLFNVDWSKIPAPHDDEAAKHLHGATVPSHPLAATDGRRVDLSTQLGCTVVFIYPMTGQPGVALPVGWNDIPGARGCTPQSCAFRDLAAQLRAAGAHEIFGLSTQTTSYQREAVERLHLPFALLSDAEGRFGDALKLPVMDVAGQTLLKRMTLIIRDARIISVFYPVFPPDKNASEVLAWLKAHPE